MAESAESAAPRTRGLLGRAFAVIGPGVITAAVVLGPGSITVSTKCGALMGCTVLWVAVVAGLMMITFTYLGAKVGMVAEQSLLTTTARKYGRWVAVLMGLSGFFIATGFQTGDNVGVGIALSAMFGAAPVLWAVVFTAVALFILWISSSVYQVVEKVMVVLVAVMILAFLGNLLRIGPDAGAVLDGLVPSKPAIFGLVIAISATTFSVAAAAFQPYLVRAKGWTKADVKKGLRDSTVGIALLVCITCTIMITSATILKPAGVKVTNAVDMAKQLEPLLGSFAKWMFLTGLWAGAFSSFIVNAMVGGTLLADGLGIGDRLDSFWSKVLASIVMVLGTVIMMIFQGNPIELITMAQATTILGVPLIALVMWMLTNSKSLMGSHRNGVVVNAIVAVALVWLLYLSGRQAWTFYQKATAPGTPAKAAAQR